MSVHEIRLQSELGAMQKFRSQVVTWETVGSTMPPDTYRITYHLRSIIALEDSTPIYRDRHQIEVHLPPKYPRCPPSVHIITRPYVYHPNVYKSGRVCIEDRWKPVGMYLDTICELVGQMIAYQKVNLGSPANPDAQLMAWVHANQDNASLIPTDKSQIRLPEVKDTIVWGETAATPKSRIEWS